ncbi:hypothetical protein [Massilia putida]|uniref:hypothetical protein n=1 Tax=Massilia putida TaxID=1141883 RepID=UPI000A652747|nr:hypothetical protein [Massilia putida]
MRTGPIKPRHAILGLALVAAGLLAAFGDKAPAGGIAEPVVRPAAQAVLVRTPAPAPARAPVAQPAAKPADAGQAVLALVSRDVLIGEPDAAFGQGQNGAGPFTHQDWTPPPPPPQQQPAPPPPPPTAPPLPFTFIGKSVGDGVWEVYLARGARTYVVRDKGEVIDGTYRVDAITPPVLTLTYLPLNQVQQLNIGVFD